jgi:hypothetical protein
MAMLTNAYETQVVQSLGVKIGPQADAGAASQLRAEGASAGQATSGGSCPFTAMIPGNGEVKPSVAGEPIRVRWTAAAEARLANIPEFVRPMAKIGIEKFAQERGALEVDEKILDAAKDFFGM